VLSRPGFRKLAQDATVADARRRLVDEYRAYEAELTSAWKKDADSDHDDKGPSGFGERRDALPSRGDAKDSRQAAYQAYDESVTQQWRSPTA
jgi:hypothetical protein